MKSYPLSNIFEVFKKLNYVYNTKPYMLNIVGIRVNEVPNTFDDTMVVFWKDNNNVWNKREYPITTDTGTFWLNNPMEKKLGSGMMKEGQYLDTYKIGKHRGKYNALRQEKIVCAYRERDKDDIFTFNENSVGCGKYSMNIHKAGIKSDVVNNWSAGCQVFSKTADFNEFMKLVYKQQEYYPNTLYTYTLLDTRNYTIIGE